jgi:glycosyltransferase involved in cell wall biosynthesis
MVIGNGDKSVGIMKIAYIYDVIHPYVTGGVQVRIWEAARRLSTRGHDVTVFGMKHWEGDDIIYRENVRLWGVCPPLPLFVDGRRSVREAVSFAWHLLPPLMKEKYDVIDIANFPYFPCFTAALHHLAKGSRLIITWHEVWDEYWLEYMGRKGLFGKAVERLTVHMPHRAIAVSDRTMKRLRALGRRDIQVIPSGVDLSVIREVQPAPISADVIFVGRMIKEKNIPLLIEAMRLTKNRGRSLRCLLVGDGPERVRLQKMTTDMDLQSHVFFQSAVESSREVFALMKSSRVLVLPSVREGLALVMIEANACGIPVVAVRHPYSAASDLVIEGQNGFSCDLSAADLADKLLAAIDRHQPWQDACRDAARGYDWDLVVDALEKIYQGS